MKKVLSSTLTLFTNENYPYRASYKSKKVNKITIGIGGNIGNSIRVFNKLFHTLKSDSRFDIIKTAPILKNPPFGYLEQNYFYNSIVVLKTDLSPYEALKQFQRYENRFKRKRTFQDAPRTLDIDIIFFNRAGKPLILNNKDLIIPHKGWKERESVLIPLGFI